MAASVWRFLPILIASLLVAVVTKGGDSTLQARVALCHQARQQCSLPPFDLKHALRRAAANEHPDHGGVATCTTLADLRNTYRRVGDSLPSNLLCFLGVPAVQAPRVLQFVLTSMLAMIVLVCMKLVRRLYTFSLRSHSPLGGEVAEAVAGCDASMQPDLEGEVALDATAPALAARRCKANGPTRTAPLATALFCVLMLATANAGATDKRWTSAELAAWLEAQEQPVLATAFRTGGIDSIDIHGSSSTDLAELLVEISPKLTPLRAKMVW